MNECMEHTYAENEQEAMQAMANIRHFITAVRNLPEFSAHGNLFCPRNTAPQLRKSSKPLHEIRIIQRLRKAMVGCARKPAEFEVPVKLVNAASSSPDNVDPGKAERIQLVFDFLLPLLRDLSDSYEQLDLTMSLHESVASQCSSKSKPTAPRGLLSLRDYTDIGCLLELTVVTSILPTIEPNILQLAETRIQRVPKAMKGRLPAMALLWGSAVASGCQSVDPTSPVSYTTSGMQALYNSAQELYSTALSIAKLCIMERFRPMFLPRHIADIYAALHQTFHWHDIVQVWVNKKGSFDLLGESMMMNQGSLSFLGQLGFFDDNDPVKCGLQTLIVDQVLVVKTYQCLLSFGSKKTPRWLRHQVARKLNCLAAIDLESILFVFVDAAKSLSNADMTTAATRLAHALIPSSSVDPNSMSGPNEYLVSVVSQLADSMDRYIDCRETHEKMSSITNIPSLAGPLTAAALIPLLLEHHKDLICQFWIQKLVAPINCKVEKMTEGQISRIIHRFYVWLCCTAPPTPALCALLAFKGFCAQHNQEESNAGSLHNFTVLQLFFRLAASAPLSPHLNMTKSIVIQILEPLVSSEQDPASYNRLITLAICFINTIAVTKYDISGPTYFAPSSNGACECRRRSHTQENTQNCERVLDELHARCNVAVQFLHQLNIRLESCEQNSEEGNLRHQFPLSASVFEVLLLAYLSFLPKWRGSSSMKEEPLLLRILQQESVKLSALSLLPLLVENLEVLELLGTSAVHVLRMIYFILIDGVSDIRDFSSNSDLKFFWSECSITKALFTQDDADALSYFLHDQINDKSKLIQVDEEQSNDVDSTVVDSRISMSSLCLSLLLTILQLGEQHRVSVEEDYFRKFLPILKLYAQDLDCDRHMSLEEAAARSSMAEIAAHTCVLIVSRDAFEEKKKKEKHEQQDVIGVHCGKLVKLITQAEQDLGSTMAPIRARGMVSLMRAARAEVKIHDHDLDQRVKSFCNIRESAQSAQDSYVTLCYGTPSVSERAWCRCDLERMLQLALLAIEDNDSFVFLAAVQTLSSLCDVNPQYFLPRLTSAISRGILENNKSVNGHEESPIAISISCRVKLCDSLIFAIRRRGEALGHYSVSLVDELLRGCRSNVQEVNDLTEAVNFTYSDEQQTTSFFIEQQTYEFLNREVMDNDDAADLKEDKHRKVLVGGPIFEAEELDAVRSGCFNCLAEVVMILAQPNLVAQFIPRIVFLCLDALRLDKGRLVRRAAAFLSREVYRAAFREGKMLVSEEIIPHQLFPSLTMELVSSGEACLAATLKQMSMSNAITGKSTYDPATDARSTEALELRQLCEECGFLALASTMAKEREQSDRTLRNAPKIVQEMLKNSIVRNRGAINIYQHD